MEPGLCVRPTQRFAVIERRPQQSDVPRVPLAEVAAPRTLELLRERGYVVVTDLDDAFLRAIAAQERAFLDFYARDAARKKRCVGTVYLSERGQPMFSRGYERQQRRECFRSAARAGGAALAESRRARLGRFGGAPRDAGRRRARRGRRRPVAARDGDDDFAGLLLPLRVDDGGGNGGDASTLVGEHADVSLVVCEPVSRAPGLEVFDAKLRRWLGVEAACAPGAEVVVFGGKAFEHRTGIPACRHRVVKCAPARPRHVFLYEQKYAAFFQHLRQFDG
ncbi:hypothetical protein JL722_11553 [Aureococcus anophagefferens]|nr:hypothetical protein JL722_11553 [Aureococcus anophagefferens]